MSRRHRRSRLCAAYAVVMFVGAGCSGDDLPRQPVSGFVTLDGQPLSSGAISFYPDTLEDRKLPCSGGSDDQGRLFLDPARAGLVPGRYEVAINAAWSYQRRRAHEREPGNDQAVEKEQIPAKYNAKTQLAIDIKDAAIKEITFHLESE